MQHNRYVFIQSFQLSQEIILVNSYGPNDNDSKNKLFLTLSPVYGDIL